jgi:hypothetical protein
MQSVKQNLEQEKHPGGNPHWTKGVSGNPAGKESRAQRRQRVEQLVEAWAAPFGGVDVLTPAELQLALTAGELSLSQPRRHEDLVRRANTISRLLAQAGLANRHVRELPVEEYEPPATSASDRVDELLRGLQREESTP